MRASLSAEDRVALQMELSDDERHKLVEACEKFFCKATPASGVTKELAYSWAAHIATYLLASDVIPTGQHLIV